MKRALSVSIAILSLGVGSACGGSANVASSGPGARVAPAPLGARVNPNRPPASEADVDFMTKMVPHHAQAVLFAGWAESHGASRAVQVLCQRIVVGQRDEIVTMRNWLEDHGRPAPPAEYARMGMPMDHDMADHDMDMDHGMGMVHDMPGILTEEQLSQLDDARGAEFDRLFLTYMIGHHEGALIMVDELFASYGGAQDDFVFKLANDIGADQTIEIERMQGMLEAMQPGRSVLR